MKFVCLLLWAISLHVQPSCSLRHVSLETPEAAQRGSKVHMRCHYELEEHELLYTVKWYRGEREFCRYSPRDVPPLKIFDIPGISVVIAESGAERLTIARATAVAQGRYTCEVSAEAPSYQTSMVSAYMHVVDLPMAGPEVYGVQNSYRSGTTLRAECELRESQPAANLSFYINREQASSEHVWHSVEIGRDGLVTARSTIQFIVQQSYFKRHRLKVQCRATIYSIYYRSVELSAEQEGTESEETSIGTSSTTERPRPRHRVYRKQPTLQPTVNSSAPQTTWVFILTILFLMLLGNPSINVVCS